MSELPTTAQPPAESEPCIQCKAGRPRASEAEARQLELMNTAARLFLEKGYSKVSLEMIAREAHVAVRTIYVKFGGKAGLFHAILTYKREDFMASLDDLDTTVRPLRDILLDFSQRFTDLITSSSALRLHRMVIAEAHFNPELAEAFYEGGPKQTREMLTRFFSRPDIRGQMRDDIPPNMLTIYLLNLVMGDHMKRYLFDVETHNTPEQVQQHLKAAIDLFLRGTMR
ncbi:TetR/AcrR family transcriptional regulator [Massilia sp. BJB1822]|uniref:TetR/AcrR family transcriptional regulator n=1 Tax=Massilia sp. BJB1822 TaxID=2744470 RepID=UPI001E48A654|nr:TetR/AcrR family transcriptional regulator [Massilia sp. BJB1822]